MSTANLQYGKLEQPISFRECANLVGLLQVISKGVPIQRVREIEPQVPQIIVSWKNNSYTRESAWLDDPVCFSDPVDAIGDLTVDIIHALVSATPQSLCFHCAAVEFASGLYIFPVTYRSGKSLLATYLCNLGARLYTDDALLIIPESNAAMATGLYPRLRLPLPGHLGQSFRNFIRNRSSIWNHRYCYVTLENVEMVPYGISAPIKGIILLNREDIEEPQLEPAGRKEVIKEVILRNFARVNNSIDIVDRIAAIVDSAECYRLRYEQVPSAAELLIDRFGKL